HGADQFDGEEGGTDKLVEGEVQCGEIQNEGKAAAQEGKNQGVGHGTYHVPADVHTGAEQFLPGEVGIGIAYLAQRGGQSHGHVQNRAQSADHDAAHQQSPDSDGGTGLPQLQKRLHIRHPQTVNFAKPLSHQPENHCQQGSGDGSQHGADGFLLNSSQNGEGDDGNVGAAKKYGGQGGKALL